MSEEVRAWYDATTYGEIKNIIRDRMSVMAREYVGIGFYLRRVRDNEMYLEDGYANIYEFAATEFGMSKSTVNHCMRVNEQFSVGGNAPMIDNRYKDFSRSQLQEMLYLSEDMRNDVTPDMTVKEIRTMKNPRLDVEPETDTDNVIPGQMHIEDFPEYMPEKSKKCNRYEGYSCNIEDVIEKHFMKKGNIEGCVGCCEMCLERKKCEYACKAVKEQIGDENNSKAESELSWSENESESVEISSDWAEVITSQNVLAEERNKLNQWLEAFKEEKNPPVFIEKQKIIVEALANMVTDHEEINLPEFIQPELPLMKNNEQRKAWLRNYKDWGLWYEDEHIGCRYYRYVFENGATLVAEEYDSQYSDYVSYLHLFGGPYRQHNKYGQIKYRMHKRYNKYPNSESELVEFLKEVQRK